MPLTLPLRCGHLVARLCRPGASRASMGPLSMAVPERVERARGFSVLRLRAAAVPQLEMRYLGRVLLHAALVGAITGLAGSLFFVALEVVQRFLLEDLAGYQPLRAYGETVVEMATHAPFRPWLLLILPGLGALLGGALTSYFAPEARGGGGDAMLHAFHHEGGAVRRRVAPSRPSLRF
jgi:hypothetical protein